MARNSKNQMIHKPNYLATGMVLGICFMVATESPAFLIFGLIIGVVLDWRYRKD
jgi:hypothetical protein